MSKKMDAVETHTEDLVRILYVHGMIRTNGTDSRELSKDLIKFVGRVYDHGVNDMSEALRKEARK